MIIGILGRKGAGRKTVTDLIKTFAGPCNLLTCIQLNYSQKITEILNFIGLNPENYSDLASKLETKENPYITLALQKECKKYIANIIIVNDIAFQYQLDYWKAHCPVFRTLYIEAGSSARRNRVNLDRISKGLEKIKKVNFTAMETIDSKHIFMDQNSADFTITNHSNKAELEVSVKRWLTNPNAFKSKSSTR